MLSIDLNFYNLYIFGGGSYVVAVTYSPAYACIASLSGNSISTNFNYYLAEADGCRGITILNDYDCYISCNLGVFRYRLTAYNMYYVA